MAKGDWGVSGDGGDGKPPLRVGWVEWREGKERVDGVGVGSGACLVVNPLFLFFSF